MTRIAEPRSIAVLVGPFLSLLIAVSPVGAAASWTAPAPVRSLEGCADTSVAIDAAGDYHIVGSCNGNIGYATNTGGSWSTRLFSPAQDTENIEPQLAIDHDRIYVAYTREAFGTCGISPVAVFYRSRNLSEGPWSAEIRLGRPGDYLESFRVAGGVVHATVLGGGSLIYERLAKGVIRRYPVGDAAGSSSLRIANDGTARFVYTTPDGLRYATFTGTAIKSIPIPGTIRFDRDPVLVLDARDGAHISWIRAFGQGCGDASPPLPGTYYATNAAGTWSKPGRVTPDFGTLSLTVDIETRRVHLLVGGNFGLKYFTKTPTGAWRGERLSSEAISDVTIRLDPANGQLLAVFEKQDDDPVWYMTRR